MDLIKACKQLVVKDPFYGLFLLSLNKYYSKDENFVYYQGNIITGADVKTFEVLKTEGSAKDKDNYYENGKVIQKIIMRKV